MLVIVLVFMVSGLLFRIYGFWFSVDCLYFMFLWDIVLEFMILRFRI